MVARQGQRGQIGPAVCDGVVLLDRSHLRAAALAADGVEVAVNRQQRQGAPGMAHRRQLLPGGAVEPEGSGAGLAVRVASGHVDLAVQRGRRRVVEGER